MSFVKWNLISLLTWALVIFLLAMMHPAGAVGRVGDPVTKAVPYTEPNLPSGRREPVKKPKITDKEFYKTQVNQEWSVFGVVREAHQICIAESRSVDNQDFYAQFGLDITIGTFFIVAKSPRWDIKSSTTEVGLGTIIKEKGIDKGTFNAVVADKNRIIIPNIKAVDMFELLSGQQTGIIMEETESAITVLPPSNILNALTACIEKGVNK